MIRHCTIFLAIYGARCSDRRLRDGARRTMSVLLLSRGLVPCAHPHVFLPAPVFASTQVAQAQVSKTRVGVGRIYPGIAVTSSGQQRDRAGRHQGQCVGVGCRDRPQNSRWVQLSVLRSPDAEEKTTITFYNHDRTCARGSLCLGVCPSNRP